MIPNGFLHVRLIADSYLICLQSSVPLLPPCCTVVAASCVIKAAVRTSTAPHDLRPKAKAKQWGKIYGGGFHVFEGEQHSSNRQPLVLPFVVFLRSSFGRCLSGFHLLLMGDSWFFLLACLTVTP